MFLQARNGTGAVVKNADRSVQTADIASRSTGAIAADFWLTSQKITSLAGTIADNTTYTPGSTRYYSPGATNNFAMRTIEPSRDQLWLGWMHKGDVFLRLKKKANGKWKGFRFHIDRTTAKGTLSLHYQDDYVDQNTSSTSVLLWENTNLTDTAGSGSYSYVDGINGDLSASYVLSGSNANTGFSKTDATSQYFTVKFQGFDVFVYVNGNLLWQSKQYFDMAPGLMAVSPDGTGVIGQCNFQRLQRSFLYSDTVDGGGVPALDLRDWYAKPTTTTGSMSAGSPTLTLGASLGVVVGDFVIVAVGGEAGSGNRGTDGIGGRWPTLRFADLTALNASGAPGGGNGTFASIDSTGNCYTWNGSAWVQYTGSGYYYLKKRVPKALVSRVTAVGGGGTTLTLADNATVATTGAQVSVCHSRALSRLTKSSYLDSIRPSKLAINIPHSYYLSLGSPAYPVGMDGVNNWTLQGAGSGNCGIVVPKGANAWNGANGGVIGCANGTNLVVQDFEVRYNHGLNGYGPPTDEYGTVGWYPDAVRIATSTNPTIQRMLITDAVEGGCVLSFCDGGKILNSYIQVNTPTQNYLSQWKLNMANCFNGPECAYNTVNSPYVLERGMEAFQTTDGYYHHNTLINAMWSSNSSDRSRIEDNDFTFTQYCQGGDAGDSMLPDYRASNPTHNEVLLDFNNNINNQQGSANVGSGATIKRNNITINGPINAAGDFIPVYNFSSGSGYLIEGSYRANGVSSHTGGERGLVRVLNFGTPTGYLPNVIKGDSLGGVVVRGMRIKMDNATQLTFDIRKEIGFGPPSGTTATVEDCVLDVDSFGALLIAQNGAGTWTVQRNISNSAYDAGG